MSITAKNILEVIGKIKDAGVELWLENEALHFRATQKKLTNDLRNLITIHKQDIISFLQDSYKMKKRVLPPIVKTHNKNSATASFSQKRLWFIANMEVGGYHYNIPMAFKIAGELNIEFFQKSWANLLARHEALRTYFNDESGEVLQKIDQQYDVVLEYIDISNNIDKENKINEYIRSYEKNIFNLSHGKLYKAVIIKQSLNEHIFLFCIHHIVADAESIDILLSELSKIYNAMMLEEEVRLPGLLTRYIDYSCWQKSLLDTSYFSDQSEYWKKQLAGDLPILELPYDHPRPAQQTYVGAHYQRIINPNITILIKNILKTKNNYTMFTILLAAYFAILYRYSGQNTLIVGIPITSRAHTDLDNVVGLFVNTVAIRIDITPNMSFIDLLQVVNDKMLEAHANKEVPFEKVVDILELKRSLAYTPIFQTMFYLNEQSTNKLLLSGLDIKSINLTPPVAKFDLTLSAQVNDGKIALDFEYNVGLLDHDTISRLSNHFENLFNQLLINQSLPIKKLSLLSMQERKKLLCDFNATKRSFRKNIFVHQLFEEQVERNPTAIAVAYKTQTITYHELNEKSNQLANYLQDHGVGINQCVAVMMERSIEVAIVFMAILKAGGCFIPLDADSPKSRIQYTLQDSESSIVLTQNHLLDRITEFAGKVVDINNYNNTKPHYLVNNLPSKSKSNDLAYIIYTSGSTGKPKGVMIHHEGFAHYIMWALEYYQCRQGCGAPVHSSIAFDLTITTIFAPLCCGKTVFMVPDELGVEGLLQVLEERQDYSIIKITPAHLKLLQEVFSIEVLKKLQATVIIGGEALYESDLNFWRKHSPQMRFINEYGATETTVACTIYELSEDIPRTISIPVGKAIANSQMLVLDEYLQPQPIGVIGEIYLGGVQLARGYLKLPQLTEERFIKNPFPEIDSDKIYKTGDLGRILADGNVEFMGRIDNQVKIKGYRIELGEIEKCLEDYATIKQAVVIVQENEQKEKQLIAYIIAKNAEFDLNMIQETLRTQLPEYMLPSSYVLLDSIPLTINGKVDTKALSSITQISKPEVRFVLPTTENEKLLSEIWRKMLNLEQVGIHDNFFALGGDSIISLQIIVEARKRGLSLKPKQLFQYQTIAELGKVIGQKIFTDAEQDTLTGYFNLLPIQHWFIEHDLANINHWNQAFNLHTSKRVDPAILERSLEIMIQHHDALRLQFCKKSNGWQQAYPSKVIKKSILVSLEENSNNYQNAQLACQASLDVNQGILVHALILRNKKHDSILLAIHHLVVDGVSWRIILEDLNTIYHSLIENTPIQLPAKTTSLRYWVHKIHEKIASGSFDHDINYWKSQLENKSFMVPIDYENGNNTEETAKSVNIRLSKQDTSNILHHANKAYQTQINDLLLAALVKTLGQWSGLKHLVIDLEGHGREDLFEDVDLSRTVGWFTSTFPLALDLDLKLDEEKLILKMKSQLQSLPVKGLSYGVLRYLHPKKVTRESLCNKSTISFNYLGQFDSNKNKNELFNLTTSPVTNACASENLRPYLININGIVINGHLQFEFIYSDAYFKQKNIRKLAKYYLTNLLTVIKHCMTYKIKSNDIKYITNKYGADNITDIYSLSPMQNGMLFHSIYSMDPSEYACQMCWDIDCALDTVLLQASWNQLIQRHSVLRTIFCWENIADVQQIVLNKAPIKWIEHDWQSLTVAEQKNSLIELFKRDKKTGFYFDDAPLMRINLVKLNPNKYKLLWTFHHILLDGWSVARLITELRQLYANQPSSSPLLPFRNFISWLAQQNKTRATDFWQTMFVDYRPTPLLNKNLETTISNIVYDEVVYTINNDLSKKIYNFSKQQRITINSLFQSAWALFLRNYCQTDDVVFGVTISGRPIDLDGVESMIGNFINTLPLRVTFHNEEIVGDYLQRIQSINLELQQYEYSSLAEIQAQLGLKTGTSLFETLMVYENYPKSIIIDDKNLLPLSNLKADEHSNYPLTLIIAPQNELQVKFSYQTNYFSNKNISEIYNSYIAVIEQIIVGVQCIVKQTVGIVGNRGQDISIDTISPQKDNFIQPRNHIEQRLAKIWCDVLESRDISISDNFFALGGHSLSAIRALSRIRSEFKISMNLREFFKHAVLQNMAEEIAILIASNIKNTAELGAQTYVEVTL